MNEPVVKAAERLGVSPQRVRALIAAGRLSATKIGREWAVDTSRLPLRHSGKSGRPMSSQNAWAVLAFLSGDRPEWVDASVLARLKGYARSPDHLIGQLSRSEPRFQLHHLRVLSGDLSKIAHSPFVRTGLSAVPAGLDVLGRADQLDGYASRRALAEIHRNFRPIRQTQRPNLVLRVPTHPWILSKVLDAPPAVAAADLLDHDDPRVRGAARRLLDEIIRG